MKKVIILFTILLIVVIGGTIAQTYVKNKNFNFINASKTKATIDNRSFNLFLAKTEKEKQIGLSERSSLDQNSGMLFTFEKADFYSFWMKNMKFPIDIIFIKDNKIVTIYKNLQPPQANEESLNTFKPDSPANKVLEINAGLSDKYKFKNGDEVKFEGI